MITINTGFYNSRVVAGRSVINYLRLVIKVKVTGCEFTEAYANGWDGYIRYVSDTGLYLTGLTTLVYRVLSKKYSDIKIVGNSTPVLNYNYAVGNGWTLFDDQKQVIDAINKYSYPDGTSCTHGVISAAVNSGKTPIFASMVYNYQNSTFLILCDTTLLFNQTVKFFFDIYGEDEIGLIQGKTTRLKRVTIGMIQSLDNQLKNKKIRKEIGDFFDYLLVDECHGISNSRGKRVLSKIKAPNRYFFSGTPYDQRDRTAKFDMIGIAGAPIIKITNKRNQESGRSLKANVYIHKIHHHIRYSAKDYLLYLQVNRDRNQTISDIVDKNKGKKILIVCKYVRHCEVLLKYLGKGIYYANGSHPNRSQIVNKYAKDPSGILLTTFIIKQGINIPDIQVLINAFGGADEIAVKQISGRAIRTDGVSETVDIHDFYDVGGNLSDHSDSRIKYYKEEGYTIKKQYDE